MDTIALTGAAGKTGLATIRALARRGAAVRALVRRDVQEDAVREAGAREAVRGDLRDATAADELLHSATALYYVCPNVSPDEVAIGRTLIDAARRAGVERFVYHSVLHPQTESMPHHWRKLRVEEMLLASGLQTTILQPAAYMQNVLAHAERVTDEGVFPVPYALTARLSLVDLDDVAEAAAVVLTEPGHRDATYELCGDEALDAHAVASILGEELGRDVVAAAVEVGEWRAEARAAGIDEERCETLDAMFRYYDRHGLVGNGNVLRWLLGRPPTSFRAFTARCICRGGT